MTKYLKLRVVRCPTEGFSLSQQLIYSSYSCTCLLLTLDFKEFSFAWQVFCTRKKNLPRPRGPSHHNYIKCSPKRCSRTPLTGGVLPGIFSPWTFFLAWVHSGLVLLPSLLLQSLFSCPVPPFPSTALAMVLLQKGDLCGSNVNQRMPVTQKSLMEPSLTSSPSAACCLPDSHIILDTSLVCSKRTDSFLNAGALCCCTAYCRGKSRSYLFTQQLQWNRKCKGTYRRNKVV